MGDSAESNVNQKGHPVLAPSQRNTAHAVSRRSARGCGEGGVRHLHHKVLGGRSNISSADPSKLVAALRLCEHCVTEFWDVSSVPEQRKGSHSIRAGER